MKKIRIAVAQPYTRLADVEGNLDQVFELTRLAAACECRLVLFPECALHGYSVPPHVLEAAVTDDGPVAARLVQHARSENIVTATGVYERDRETDEVFISHFIALPSGELIVQRKSGGHEKPGIARPPVDHRIFSVDGVKCAVVICIDSARPEAPRELVDLGCQLQLVPTAGGGEYGREHLGDWNDRGKYLHYEEAMQSSCFPKGGAMWQRHAMRMGLATANLATGDDGHDYFQQGHSIIIDSTGALLALIPGAYVQEHFGPRMAWADMTIQTPQHLPADPLFKP